MNARERYRNALLFKEVDKVPLNPGNGREKTYQRWHSEGLPEGMSGLEYACNKLGLDFAEVSPQVTVNLGVDLHMMPIFEEKVLEHKDGHYIVQDWMGNVTEISDEYDYTYIRNAIDFVTRKWHKFLVETRDDWEQMKERYQVDAPGRFPDDFDERCQKLKGRDYPFGVHFSGPFWQLREWVGFEPLCMMFIEDPEFITDMCTFWKDFVSATIKPILEKVELDYIHISEDMAYKEKPMISPAMTREFLQPCYNQWVGEAKAAGCSIIDMDSDGRIDELIPIWIESGINVCDPIEVAAGCDIVEYRKRFGKDIAYQGGVDKRAMAKGGKILEAEIDRVCSILPSGGFIPCCDHGVPHDISLENYVATTRLLAERTGWL